MSKVALSPSYIPQRIAAEFRMLGAFVQQNAEQWKCGLGWRSTELLTALRKN